MQIVIVILLVVHVFVCLLLVGSVLMQLPRSEGLGAAFGGGVTENLFGAQTTNVLAKVTVWLGIAFFVLTLLLAMAYSRSQPTGSRLEQELLSSPVTAASPTSSPTAEPAASPSVEASGATGVPTLMTGEGQPAGESDASANGSLEASAESAAPTVSPSPAVAPTPAVEAQ